MNPIMGRTSDLGLSFWRKDDHFAMSKNLQAHPRSKEGPPEKGDALSAAPRTPDPPLDVISALYQRLRPGEHAVYSLPILGERRGLLCFGCHRLFYNLREVIGQVCEQCLFAGSHNTLLRDDPKLEGVSVLSCACGHVEQVRTLDRERRAIEHQRLMIAAGERIAAGAAGERSSTLGFVLS